MIVMKETMMKGMVMEENENGAIEMMKGMGRMVTHTTEKETVMAETPRSIMVEIGMGMMTPEEELKVLMTTRMDQGVGALTEMEVVLMMMMIASQPGRLIM